MQYSDTSFLYTVTDVINSNYPIEEKSSTKFTSNYDSIEEKNNVSTSNDIMEKKKYYIELDDFIDTTNSTVDVETTNNNDNNNNNSLTLSPIRKSFIEINNTIGSIIPKITTKYNWNSIKQLIEIYFEHTFDFDYNGIIYFLGTLGYSRQWVNPAKAGLLHLVSTPTIDDSEPVTDVLSRTPTRFITISTIDSYIIIHFKIFQISLQAYTLRHYSSFDGEA